MDKTAIKTNFSKHAATYEKNAEIQRLCAEKLLGYLPDRSFSEILEIGCGTGMYTRLLTERFKNAQITAVDISEEMLALAREKNKCARVSFVASDGEDIPQDKKFGLVTSNASFQWFENFDILAKNISQLISDKGLTSFSMYGPGTFRELNDTLGTRFGARGCLHSSKFLSRKELEHIIKKYFSVFTLNEEEYKMDFPSLVDLLKNIKQSGCRGDGIDIFLGKSTLKELEKIYVEKYGKITATHHVYFCAAGK